MALQDIITAISAQSNRDIAALRTAHARRTKEMRDAHETSLRSLRSGMSAQVEARKSQLLMKTKTHIAVERRNRIAGVKQAVLNAAFAETLALLLAMPDEKVEPVLRACLARVKENGVIQASKRHEALLRKIAPRERFTVEASSDAAGGFHFVGRTSEADFTFEHIVHGVLRPQKELEIAHLLLGNLAA